MSTESTNEQDRVREQIRQILGNNKVVLFMKGSAAMPQCGFSAAVVKVLREIGVPFTDVNVASDPLLREEIKAFSNWPTLPQLYINGELIGGCDIVRELHARGELAPKLQQTASS